MEKTPQVYIVMGSDSDLPVMGEAVKILKEFGVPYELVLASAHRSPGRTARLAAEAAGRGVRVIIAGAGAAAHLAGVIAAHTSLPVIGVPIDATPLQGLDALLSTVQMPGGVPVAAMAVGRPGAKNAALFAVRILALTDGALKVRLESYIGDMEAEVERKQAVLDQQEKVS